MQSERKPCCSTTKDRSLQGKLPSALRLEAVQIQIRRSMFKMERWQAPRLLMLVLDSENPIASALRSAPPEPQIKKPQTFDLRLTF